MSEVRVIEEKVVVWPETCVIVPHKVSGEAHDIVTEICLSEEHSVDASAKHSTSNTTPHPIGNVFALGIVWDRVPHLWCRSCWC